MAYTPYYSGGWQSGEEGATPITPAALNNMDDGIEEVSDAFFNTTSSTGTDFNSIMKNGTYWINAADFTNGPVDSGYGILEVTGGTNAPKLQRFTVFSSSATARPRIYERIYVNSQWYSWVSHNGELLKNTISRTTSSNGTVNISLDPTRYAVLSVYTVGYICIPYRASGVSTPSTFVKILDTSLAPVANTAVSIDVAYIDMGEGAFS